MTITKTDKKSREKVQTSFRNKPDFTFWLRCVIYMLSQFQ